MRRPWLTVALIFAILITAVAIYYNTQSPLAMGPNEAKEALKKGEFGAVVDVRSDAEWTTGHYPLAIHIPVNKLQTDLPLRIPDKGTRILFYCNTSTRARVGAETAQKMGYSNVRYLIGRYGNLLN